MKMRFPIRSGFALVLVMIAVVLAAAMAVFFLASAGRERRSVGSYARSSEARQLSTMAVNRVMGQITAASREGTAAAPISWASQPGMIRTFSGAGDPQSIYKLYSWDTAPKALGDDFDPLGGDEVPPGGWNTRTAEFTDLNQPVDGVYPILDPAAVGNVEGFSIDASNAAVSGSGNAAPMPVKWLYVLQDGQMVAPSGGSGTVATVSGASPANPIVGRIAYWTDDETAKVNINTASEGAYWDWPKAATFNEMQFAGNPPVGGEFNRLPGHPAMTSLSAVFPELAPGDRWTEVATYRSKLKDLLDLTPRVPYDNASSRGGTYPVESGDFVYGPTGSLGTIPSQALTLKTDRLYVSPDELIFKALNRTQQSIITPDMLRQREFFLTAHSRAPETTLFETPRVSLWPVTWPWTSAHASNQRMTSPSAPDPNSASLADNTWMRAEERLLAFDATLNPLAADGGDKYYFQRQNPDSPTHDYADIDRNEELLKYLQSLTALSAPGFGASLSGKWGAATRDSILVNTFSSVRSLVNQYTTQEDGRLLYSFTPVAFTRFKRTNGVVAARYAESGAFSPIPINIDLGSGNMVGTSEFPMLREAALVFFATDRVAPSYAGGTNRNNPFEWTNLINVTGAGGYPIGARTTQMRAVLLLDFAPIAGSTRSNQPVFWVKLTGGALRANGQNLDLGNAVAKMDYRANTYLLNVPAYMRPFYEKDANGSVTKEKTFTHGNVSDTNYGLISSPVSVGSTAVEFPFEGGDAITVEIYGIKDGNPALDPTSDASLRVASYEVDFSGWDGNLPIPLMPWWNYQENPNSPGTAAAAGCPSPRFNKFEPSAGATEWVAMEIARSRFKYEWHPEICGGGALFGGSFIRSDAILAADTRAYAGFPNGIPAGTSIGAFLGRQVRHFTGDCGFDFLWLSNGFGFAVEPWALTGTLFDGRAFHAERADEAAAGLLGFWRDFRREAPELPLRTRGTNLGTGVDLGSEASPLREIYREVPHLEPPVNSPWAALDADIGLELAGWMAHVARTPGQGFRFRYYIHDAWWLNSPWLDRYQRQPYDIYLPLSVSRLRDDGRVEPPCDLAFLSIDDSHGCLRPNVPPEVTAHILHAREFAPDAAGPVVWVYPFDGFHDAIKGTPPRPDLPFFGDWFARGLIMHGVPLNTVADETAAEAVLRENPQALAGSILVVPALPGQQALWNHAASGGTVLAYGPLDDVPELREMLGLELGEPLEGDFSPTWPEAHGRTLRHLSCLSAGGWRETGGDSAFTATQGSAVRTAGCLRKLPGGGSLAWVRGSLATAEFDPENPRPIRGPRLTDLDVERFAFSEDLAREFLARMGVESHVPDGPGLRPMVTLHRHANAFVFSGFQSDGQRTIGLRLAMGAPLFPGQANRIVQGRTQMAGTPWCSHACRAFIQQESGNVRCRILPAIQHGYQQRLLIQGAQDATVTFFPLPGTEARLEILRAPKFPYFHGDFVKAEPRQTPQGICVTVTNVTGELLFSW